MSKYIPPPPVRPTEPKTNIIIENGTIPTPPPILGRPPTVQRTNNISKGVSGNDVMLGFCCLLVGAIFGLLIGRFV